MTQDAAARRGATVSDVGPHDGSTSTQGASASSVGTTVCYVTVRGQQLRVAVRPGSGAGTPLVLCGGLGAGFEVLQPLVDALPADIEVIRFDVPGVGGSPTGPLPYRFGQLAFALARVLDELGYDQVDVLGFSWGGALAQQFAAQHPRRCRRLVLVSTGTGMVMVPGRPSALVKMIGPRRFREPDYAASIVADLYGGSAHRRQGDLRDALDSQQIGGSLLGYVYQLAAGIGWTSLPFLKLIRQPTLVMGGGEDPIVPVSNARLLARLIPHARLHIYRGGHVELITETAELVPVVTSFLGTDPGELR
jgi:poly(3-hydroxyalkanoate) depolymerase